MGRPRGHRHAELDRRSRTCCLVDEKRVSAETLEALGKNVEALLCRTEQSVRPESFLEEVFES